MTQFSYDLPDEIAVESDGDIRIVRMNRPDKLNAVNEGLHYGMATVWRQISKDPGARAVVLTGAGKAFSAGGDFDFFTRVIEDLDYRRDLMREARDVVREMIDFPLPVVAAVNGPAVGLGCSVAVLCDLVVMDENAFLADPHVAIGLVAGDGGAATWPLFTSLLKAKEYILLGGNIPAVEAERLGLANRVAASGTSLEEALGLARRLAALPQQALQDTKRALNLHIDRACNGILEFALAAESECFISDEFKAAISGGPSKKG